MHAILHDLGADTERLQAFASRSSQEPSAAGNLLLELTSPQAALPTAIELLSSLSKDGLLLVALKSMHPSAADLAGLRNRLCPTFHVIAIYRTQSGVTKRESLSGNATLEQSASESGTVLALRIRAWVMSPAATVEKFDQNAEGWNGDPKNASYAHFRWMRRFVAGFGGFPRTPGLRVLDFGCGAGWVGIEAALKLQSPQLSFFDPSPAMVRIATENAHHAGLSSATGRTGFGEAPPFPAGVEQPFDLVISSGVLSFSPDLERWFTGLKRCVQEGGTLIIGDINPDSRGFTRRRAKRPLLPVRELNGRSAAEVREQLEALGFRHRSTAGYQLTYPIPELMHLSAERLGGILNPPLLVLNRLMAWLGHKLGHRLQGHFDSWVMRFDAPHPKGKS